LHQSIKYVIVGWFTVTDNRKTPGLKAWGFSFLVYLHIPNIECLFGILLKILYIISMSKSFKKPDLHAPRFRNKHVALINSDLLTRFKTKYPEHSSISLQQFKKIISTFNEKLSDGIIENRDGVELPEGLGYIFIGTCPQARKKNIDMFKSAQYGVITEHKNWDSDNKVMKIFYTNRPSKYPLANKQLWVWQSVKQFRKKASAAYKKDWPKYISVDNTKKISLLFDSLKKKEHILKSNTQIPDDWDEFKI